MKKSGNYERTLEHKMKMAEICSAGAKGARIDARKAKYRTVDGEEQRFCAWCQDWFALSHYYERKCKSKMGIVRLAHDCKVLAQPKGAYFLAKYRCRSNKYYTSKGIQVRITLAEWVPWWLAEQAKAKLSRPTVDRINSDGHYEIGNIQLIDRGENSTKACNDTFSKLEAARSAGPQLADILTRVCTNFGYLIDAIGEKGAKQEASLVRQAFVYMCRKLTDYSYEAIGKAINRTHATVMFAFKQAKRKMKADPLWREQIEKLMEET